jgi:cellobiose phosphorylase
MYRLIVESLLGLQVAGETLRMDPCLPADWKGVKLNYRYRDTRYQIVVTQGSDRHDEPRVTVDGIEQTGLAIPLIDDRLEHSAEVRLGSERQG